MSVQSASRASVQPYQANLPVVQNPSQQTGQNTTGQYVKTGEGHHYQSKAQRA